MGLPQKRQILRSFLDTLRPYKGLIQPRLKTHEWFSPTANNYWLPLRYGLQNMCCKEPRSFALCLDRKRKGYGHAIRRFIVKGQETSVFFHRLCKDQNWICP